MKRMLTLLPSSKILVHQSEVDEYATVVPSGQLVKHDEPDLVHVRNYAIDYFQCDCLVMIDDDFKGVTTVRNSKTTVNPTVIMEIILNSRDVCNDVGVGVFCWNRNKNPRDFFDFNPVAWSNNPISSSFGLTGPARSRKFDPRFPGRADLDYTLRTLQGDRVIFSDRRYVFDHGRIFTGKGGNVGLITTDMAADAERNIIEKWGRYVEVKRGSRTQGDKGRGGGLSPGIRLKVRRKQALL